MHGWVSGQASQPKSLEIYKQTVRSLEYILDGYCLAEPMFTEHYSKLLSKLIKALRDPMLPLQEMQEILNAMSGQQSQVNLKISVKFLKKLSVRFL